MEKIQLSTEEKRSEIFTYLENNYPRYSSSDQIKYALDLDQILECNVEGERIQILNKFEEEIRKNNPDLQGGFLTLKVIHEIHLELDQTLQKILAEINAENKF